MNPVYQMSGMSLTPEMAFLYVGIFLRKLWVILQSSPV